MSNGIFSATVVDGELIVKSADYPIYLQMMDGREMVITLKETTKYSPKARLYNYLHSVVFDNLVIGFENAGYPGMTKAVVKKIMKDMFALEEYESAYTGAKKQVLDLSDMTKPRLLKFVKDCLFFLESEFQIAPPDSEAYKTQNNEDCK